MALLLYLFPSVLVAADNTPSPFLLLNPSFSAFSSFFFSLLNRVSIHILKLNAAPCENREKFISLLTAVIQRKVILGVAEFLRSACNEDIVLAKEILKAGHL